MVTRIPLAVSILLLSSPAFAQIDGALQIGLGTDLISSSTVELEGETPLGGAVSVDSEADIETTKLGLGGNNGVTVNVGYGLTEQMILGGFLQLGNTTTETNWSTGDLSTNSETETTGIVIGPRFEFSFLERGDFRPYVLASLAYASLTQETENGDEVELSGAQLLGGAGLHWFLAPGFSIDPGLYASYTFAGGELDPDAGDNTDLDGSVLAFGISIGLSGWVR